MKKFVLSEQDELVVLIKEALVQTLIEIEDRKKKKEGEQLYTKNQVRKKLGIAHKTVSNYVKNGVLRSTASGLIPQSAIEEFISNRG